MCVLFVYIVSLVPPTKVSIFAPDSPSARSSNPLQRDPVGFDTLEDPGEVDRRDCPERMERVGIGRERSLQGLEVDWRGSPIRVGSPRPHHHWATMTDDTAPGGPMSFKSEQGKLQKKGFSKKSAGKILGAAAQKAKHPSPNQKKVLRAQGRKVK